MVFDKQNYEQFKKFIEETDPKIHKIVIKHGYVKPHPKRNPFANIVGVIIGQKIRISLAQSLRGTDNFTPEQFLKIGEDGLKKLGIDEVPRKTIIRLTDHIIDSQIKLETPSDIRLLSKIKGIGPWIIIHSLTDDKAEFDDTILYTDIVIKRGV